MGFLALVGYVVYSSSYLARYQCEVCIPFRGQEVCRRVEAQTADEARRGAVTNACAVMVAGVTDTIACERTNPSRADCSAVE